MGVRGWSDQYCTIWPSVTKRLGRRFGLIQNGVSQFASRYASTCIRSGGTNALPKRG